MQTSVPAGLSLAKAGESFYFQAIVSRLLLTCFPAGEKLQGSETERRVISASRPPQLGRVRGRRKPECSA